MICFFCHRPIRGADVAGRYEWRRTLAAGTRIYGKGEHSLREANGQLVRLSHGRCYHAWRKQEQLAVARDADPSSQSRQETDWREQSVVDVEELREGNGDN
jgi:hypothetical protein